MTNPLLSLISSPSLHHPLCIQARHEHVLGQSDILLVLGGCFLVQSNNVQRTKYRHVTSRHVTSRHVTYNAPVALLSPFYDRRKQLLRLQYGRVHQYIMETGTAGGCVAIFCLPVFCQLFIAREFVNFLILAKPVWLDLAYVW